MPQYQFTSPEGKSISFEYEGEVTEPMLDELFARPEVADRPLTEVEFSRKFDIDKDKDFDWSGLGKGLMAAPGVVGGMLVEAAKDSPAMFSKKGVKTSYEAAKYGTMGTINLAKNIWGNSVEAIFMDREEEKANEYERYLDNYQFNEERKKLIESGEVLKGAFEVGEMVLDATNLIPFAGQGKFGVQTAARAGAKGMAKAGAKVAGGAQKVAQAGTWVTSMPRKIIERAAEKAAGATAGEYGKGALYGQLAAAVSGTPVAPIAFGLMTKEAGFRAADIGLDAFKDILTAAGKDGHKRFLDRLASDPDLLKRTPFLRDAAGWAASHGGTKLGDKAFEAILTGAELGTIQGALAFVGGASEEEIGQAIGTGVAMGAPMGAMLGKEGAGASLDVFDKKGSQTARTKASVENFAENIHNQRQLKRFKELDKTTQAVVAVMDEIGAKKQGLRTKFAEQALYDRVKPDDADSFSFFDAESGTVVVNSDAPKKMKQQAIVNQMIGQYSNIVVSDMIRNNPMVKDSIMAVVRDEQGNIKEEFQNYVDRYNDKVSEHRKIETDDQIAEKIGAETLTQYITGQKGLSSVGDPKALKTLRNSSSEVLNRIGATDEAGNLLDSPLSRQLLKDKSIAGLYKRHLELRNRSANAQARELDKGVLVKRDSLANRGVKIYESQKISKADLKSLKELLKKYDLTEYVGLGRDFYGTKVAKEIKEYFNRNKAGRELVEKFNLLEQAISENRKVIYGAINRGNRNEFRMRDIIPFHIRSDKRIGNISIVGYDSARVMHNIDMAIDAGIVRGNRDKIWNQLNDIQKQLRQDPSTKEAIENNKIGNELIAAIFGAKADTIKDPKIKAWMEKYNIKPTFRGHIVADMNSLEVGSVAPAFNYNKVRNNEI